jgi:hypothetical protein
MRLADWFNASAEPGALGDDGVHPTKHGARIYTWLISAGLRDAPPPPPTTTTTAPPPTTTTTAPPPQQQSSTTTAPAPPATLPTKP